jgi:lysophospholipase L1-like esterase
MQRGWSLSLSLALCGVLACSSVPPDAAPGSGGAAAVAGSPGISGTTAVAGSTATPTGGTTAIGDPTAMGGSMDAGIAAAGGDTSMGGATAAGGGNTTIGGSSAGGAPGPAGDTIPAGYPAPTATNYAQCKPATPTGGYCPGGGVGPSCIECLFGGNAFNNTTTATAQATMEAGNYLVTVQLGGAVAGQTYVSAESNRSLLQPFSTAAGESKEFAFVVNVRPNESEPAEAVGAGYPGLDLFFSGPTATPPQVSAIGYTLVTPATKPVMVYMASDSTECDQPSPAFAGWGQMLPGFFAPPIGIANYGDSGESSASFYGNPKLWGAVKAHWVAGDWVIIQFGHNDKGVADATVQANLEKYVTDALAAKVTPIIVSPPARVQFMGNVDGDQSSLHAAAAKAAAAAKNVAYIDLTSLSIAWYNTLGSQAAALKFHANDSDATHTNLAGAQEMASLVVGALKSQNIPLAQYLRP